MQLTQHSASAEGTIGEYYCSTIPCDSKQAREPEAAGKSIGEKFRTFHFFIFSKIELCADPSPKSDELLEVTPENRIGQQDRRRGTAQSGSIWQENASSAARPAPGNLFDPLLRVLYFYWKQEEIPERSSVRESDLYFNI